MSNEMRAVVAKFGNSEYDKLDKIMQVLHTQGQIPQPTMYALAKWWFRELIKVMEQKGVV